MNALKIFKKSKEEEKEEKSEMKDYNPPTTLPQKWAPEIKTAVSVKTAPLSASFKRVVKYPLTSEKAANLQKFNQYVFLVEKSANKKMIRQEIQKHYNVKIKGVNIIRQSGKIKRFGNRLGRRPAFKKAIVTLMPGEKINISTVK